MDSLIERLREWADLPAHLRLLGSVEGIFDQENRHKSGKKSVDYSMLILTMWPKRWFLGPPIYPIIPIN